MNLPSNSANYARANAQVEKLQRIVVLRLDELFEKLAVRLVRNSRMYVGSCPIHGGDNQSALNLYHGGDLIPGIWRCNTHHCERTFHKTIIGFARGVLSHQQLGWAREGDRALSFKTVVNWLCQFVGVKFWDIQVDTDEVERKRFAAAVTTITKKPGTAQYGVTRKQVRAHLLRPAKFFLDRGYSADILDQYDVGLYPLTGRELSQRVVVPIYNQDGLLAIGFSGRSVWPQCPSCSRWHEPTVACDALDPRSTSKWRHSPVGFNVSSCLYNLWRAARPIRESGSVILVEGPADVWRLEEAGIHNSVALLGCEMSDEQQILLERSGAMSATLLLDNDAAGQKGLADIARRLERSYRLKLPSLTAKDVGELSIADVRSLLNV